MTRHAGCVIKEYHFIPTHLINSLRQLRSPSQVSNCKTWQCTNNKTTKNFGSLFLTYEFCPNLEHAQKALENLHNRGLRSIYSLPISRAESYLVADLLHQTG